MAQYNTLFEDKVKRAIRDILALDPLITMPAVVEALNKRFDHSFDIRYIRRLANKVGGEQRMALDRAKFQKRLISLQETHRLAREKLLKIIYWTPEQRVSGMLPPLARDQVEAVKNLVMLDIAVMNAEIANGVYALTDRPHYAPMAPEMRVVVIEAFRKWGKLPDGEIETMVPALPEHANTEPQSVAA